MQAKRGKAQALGGHPPGKGLKALPAVFVREIGRAHV